jgi:hypothetical protein
MERTPLMEWTFPASGPLRADLELAAGTVEVTLATTDEVRVELEPEGRDNELAREQIANASVTCDGSHLDVRVPKRKLREASLRLRVLVPSSSSARVRTASADITCLGPLAGFEAKTASGDITVRDDCDSARIQTASGDVRLAGVLGELDVQTASGDVTSDDIGGRISVTTASGDVRVGAIAHDARFRTASGDVSIGCAYEGELSVNGVSGDVRIGVGPGVGTWLDLITVSGDSKCTLASEGESENGSTLRITCRTVSGDILVHSGDTSGPGRDGSGGGETVTGVGPDLGAGARAFDLPVLPDPSAFPGEDAGPASSGFPFDAGFSGAGPSGPTGFLSGIPGLQSLAKLADLADLGDLADMMRGRSTTERWMGSPGQQP